MYKIDLPPDLKSCPSCWQNWVRDFNERWCRSDSAHSEQGLSQESLHFKDANLELTSTWQAQLAGDSWDSCNGLEFPVEKDAVIFVLRWS